VSDLGRPLEGHLPCTVALDDLLEQVADHGAPADPAHQASCPYCRATLAELKALWEPVHQAAARPVHAPPALMTRVMEHIRLLTRDGLHAVLAGAGDGVTTVAVWVIAVIARRAAAAVPGVAFVLGKAGAGRDSGVGAAGRSVVIRLEVVATYGQDLRRLGEQVRQRVAGQVQALTGCTVTEVDVRFVDVLPTPEL
jgi:uncharacterized alkaline shock family protein YloU